MKTLIYNKATKTFSLRCYSDLRYRSNDVDRNIELSVQKADIPAADKSAMIEYIKSNKASILPSSIRQEFYSKYKIEYVWQLYRPDSTSTDKPQYIQGEVATGRLAMLVAASNEGDKKAISILDKYKKIADDAAKSSEKSYPLEDPHRDAKIKNNAFYAVAKSLNQSDQEYADELRIKQQVDKFNNWRFNESLAVKFVEAKYSSLRSGTLDKYRRS